MKKKVFALVDCNNFFVSCERVFNPKIKNLPVLVLSNNDGCVVARSNEVKALGIKMGTPLFKCKKLIKENNIQIFSSNYALYADMSNRVMATLRQFSPDMEIYSIDEAFIGLGGFYSNDYENYGSKIRKIVLQWTGIPVSVGVAGTKCLSKVANEIAKKHNRFNGVVDFENMKDDEIDEYLDMIEVNDVWGIGSKYAKRLNLKQIYTAKELKYSDPKWIKRILNVMGERIVLELRGIGCYGLEENPGLNKGICCSRSFGYPVTKFNEMKEAVASYIAKAAERLRKQSAYSNIVIVYIKTNRFKDTPQYSNAAYIKLIEPTSSTIELTKYALYCLNKIFKNGYKYKKCGVLLEGIQPDSQKQLNCFYGFDEKDDNKKICLMQAVDSINSRFGHGKIKLAAEGVFKKWKMKRNILSKCYTTNINELLEVRL